MGNYLERCRELRADTTRHYGCAQAVFIPFAEEIISGFIPNCS